jgi:hypothetical protein
MDRFPKWLSHPSWTGIGSIFTIVGTLLTAYTIYLIFNPPLIPPPVPPPDQNAAPSGNDPASVGTLAVILIVIGVVLIVSNRAAKSEAKRPAPDG